MALVLRAHPKDGQQDQSLLHVRLDCRDALSKFQTKHQIPAECYLQKPLNVDRLIGLVKKMMMDSFGQEGYAKQYSSQHGSPGEQFA